MEAHDVCLEEFFHASNRSRGVSKGTTEMERARTGLDISRQSLFHFITCDARNGIYNYIKSKFLS